MIKVHYRSAVLLSHVWN